MVQNSKDTKAEWKFLPAPGLRNPGNSLLWILSETRWAETSKHIFISFLLSFSTTGSTHIYYSAPWFLKINITSWDSFHITACRCIIHKLGCMHLNSTSPLLVGVKLLKTFSIANNAATKNSSKFVLLHIWQIPVYLTFWFLSVKFLVQRVFICINVCNLGLLSKHSPREINAHMGREAVEALCLSSWCHISVSNGLLDHLPPRREPFKVFNLYSYPLTGEGSHRCIAGSVHSLFFWKSLPKFSATTSCWEKAFIASRIGIKVTVIPDQTL